MKLYIETLGCLKNSNDSEGIGGIWEKSGQTVTDDPWDADVILVNTCAFINDAKTESINTIFDMVRLAKEKEESGLSRPLLIVAGCLGQRYGSELVKEIPEVDIFMGVNDYEKLPAIEAERNKLYCSPATDKFMEFSSRKLDTNPYVATLRIAEGCNNCCAYCVIPQIRGGYRSRPMESIIEEAEVLAKAGTKELILIAQDVTEYGRDIYGELRLPALLRRLCRVEGIRWIRLMYCYEDKITEELIKTMAEEEKICNYIDIPLQHISDSVLKAMRRRSTERSIRDTIGALRRAIPDIHIRTTFITGFPGETEEDFEKLAAFAEETEFERLGVFAYSREEGTPAGDMECQIDEEIKDERADSIMRLQIDISRRNNMKKIGKVFEVIVDGVDADGAYLGRTVYDAPEIDNTVIFSGDDDRVYRPGDMVKVRITDAFDYDLTGTVCG
ncbi:MAG: 30S ribosomal protein S12 methylthiotransferase RimO [Lentihominibacter sp.]